MADVQDVIRRLIVEAQTRGLDKATADLNKFSAATTGVAKAADAAGQSTTTVEKSLGSTGKAFERAANAVDPVRKQIQLMTKDLAVLEKGRGLGGVSDAQIDQLKQMRTLQADANIQILKSVPAHAAQAKATGLASHELKNLGMQANDAATMLLSGSSVFQVMATQGGQVLQVLQGGQGVTGNLKSLGSTLVGMVNPTKLAFGGMAAGIALVGAGIAEQAASNQEFETTLKGVGRQSGATAGQLEEVAQAAAKAGDITVSSSRELVNAYAKTGKIGVDSLGVLAARTADFAAQTGTDLDAATKTLTAAFADPAKGIDVLKESLGGVSLATQQTIKNLVESGQSAQAAAMLMEVLNKNTLKASESMSVLGKAFALFMKDLRNLPTDIGKGLEDAFAPGLEAQLKEIDAQIAKIKAGAGGMPSLSDMGGAGPTQDTSGRLQALEAQKRATQDLINLERQRAGAERERIEAENRAVQVKQIVKDTFPEIAQLERVTNQIKAIELALADQAKGWGKVDEAAQRATQETLQSLRDVEQALKKLQEGGPRGGRLELLMQPSKVEAAGLRADTATQGMPTEVREAAIAAAQAEAQAANLAAQGKTVEAEATRKAAAEIANLTKQRNAAAEAVKMDQSAKIFDAQVQALMALDTEQKAAAASALALAQAQQQGASAAVANQQAQQAAAMVQAQANATQNQRITQQQNEILMLGQLMSAVNMNAKELAIFQAVQQEAKNIRDAGLASFQADTLERIKNVGVMAQEKAALEASNAIKAKGGDIADEASQATIKQAGENAKQTAVLREEAKARAEGLDLLSKENQERLKNAETIAKQKFAIDDLTKAKGIREEGGDKVYMLQAEAYAYGLVEEARAGFLVSSQYELQAQKAERDGYIESAAALRDVGAALANATDNKERAAKASRENAQADKEAARAAQELRKATAEGEFRMGGSTYGTGPGQIVPRGGSLTTAVMPMGMSKEIAERQYGKGNFEWAVTGGPQGATAYAVPDMEKVKASTEAALKSAADIARQGLQSTIGFATRALSKQIEAIQEVASDQLEGLRDAASEASEALSDAASKRQELETKLKEQEDKRQQRIQNYLAAGPSPFEKNADIFYDPKSRLLFAEQIAGNTDQLLVAQLAAAKAQEKQAKEANKLAEDSVKAAEANQKANEEQVKQLEAQIEQLELQAELIQAGIDVDAGMAESIKTMVGVIRTELAPNIADHMAKLMTATETKSQAELQTAVSGAPLVLKQQLGGVTPVAKPPSSMIGLQRYTTQHFQHGGEFTVPGSYSAGDRPFVLGLAGQERVTVQTPAQQAAARRGAGGTQIENLIVQMPPVSNPIEYMNKRSRPALSRAVRGMARGMH